MGSLASWKRDHPTARDLKGIYRRLFSRFGRQHWWPGDGPFEVMIGAILTQNTAWSNAAKAIHSLKQGRFLEPVALHTVALKRLARLIRSSGYFNQKAERLKTFVRYFLDRYGGNVQGMRRVPWRILRKELLTLKGIGPETADSILLYALEKPVFVVDAYTRRVLARHSFISWQASYEEIQELFMERLFARTPYFSEYHALFVAVGKEFCRTRPRCHACPLQTMGRLRLEPDIKPVRSSNDT